MDIMNKQFRDAEFISYILIKLTLIVIYTVYISLSYAFLKRKTKVIFSVHYHRERNQS